MEYTLIVTLANERTAIRKVRYDFPTSGMDNAVFSQLKRCQLNWVSVRIYHTATGDFIRTIDNNR